MAVSARQTRAQQLLEQVREPAHFVGGEWVPARSGDSLDVINPATGEVLRRVPRGAAADVADAVEAAARAFPAWRDTDPRGERICSVPGAISATSMRTTS